ncbi:ricin-type beta-trefoil lectin domain protein [Streptomyces bluensis]|uniref:ricin-type beta-trefoil lectin domain protein n=1 Tax=Streptomyces bluensis TaxID=33897 RepID=UPI0033318D7D
MPRRSGGLLLRLLAATVLTVTSSVTASAHSTAAAVPGSPALTPPLGRNSWNSFGRGITEAQVREAADAMVSSGMKDAGYQYVVVDDCWFDPQRHAAGHLRANPAKFPSGKKALGALRSLFSAPRMAGNDIRTMSADVSANLRNPRLPTVNQDSLGTGGRRVRDDGGTEVFAKPLSDGSVAVGLFNRGEGAATVTTTTAQVGLSGARRPPSAPGSFALTDLWTGGTSSTSGQISASVPAHGVAVFRVSGGSPQTATTSRLRGSASGRCLEVDNASTAAGATALIWDCHMAANQLRTTWAGGEIRVFGDKCLDAYNRGTTNGTRVITWPCNGQANQKWTRA